VRAPRCPTCRQPVAPRGANRAFPFCSERCRLLDLGRWFDGRYRIAGPPADDAEPGPAAGEGDGEPPES
jgi:uncharacterized protein